MAGTDSNAQLPCCALGASCRNRAARSAASALSVAGSSQLSVLVVPASVEQQPV